MCWVNAIVLIPRCSYFILFAFEEKHDNFWRFYSSSRETSIFTNYTDSNQGADEADHYHNIKVTVIDFGKIHELKTKYEKYM